MKQGLTKRALIVGSALWIAGVLLGGGSAYWLVQHRQLTLAKQSATATAQQASRKSNNSGDMAGMPGMDISGKHGTDASSQQNTASDSAMRNTPGMDTPTSSDTGQSSTTSTGNPGETTASMENRTPGTVMLDPATQQEINVTYTTVRRAHLERTIQTVGLLQWDEEKIAHVHVKVSGWIEKLFLNDVGQQVKKGQPLFTLYSPDLVSTEQEDLIALRGQRYLSKTAYTDVSSESDSLLSATRDRLRLWDISDSQIHHLESSGKVQRDMTLDSPSSGFVMARNAYEKTYVTPETDLYDIGDLSTIWVYVDIFEYEAPYVHVGQSARMELSYFPGRTYRGKISYVYPTLDPKTRTIKARLEFPNPGYELKPNMYANVQLNVDYGTQTLVPSQAVLNSGTRQVVFVARGGGYFEPRDITIGDQFNGQTVVLAGLHPGEKIVASGNFLIDSESRLGAATQRMTASMPGMRMSSGKK